MVNGQTNNSLSDGGKYLRHTGCFYILFAKASLYTIKNKQQHSLKIPQDSYMYYLYLSLSLSLSVSLSLFFSLSLSPNKAAVIFFNMTICIIFLDFIRGCVTAVPFNGSLLTEITVIDVKKSHYWLKEKNT